MYFAFSYLTMSMTILLYAYSFRTDEVLHTVDSSSSLGTTPILSRIM